MVTNASNLTEQKPVRCPTGCSTWSFTLIPLLQPLAFSPPNTVCYVLTRQNTKHFFRSETWSAVTDHDVGRMQVVDNSLIRDITGGHLKTPSEFHFLETGSLMPKHVLSIKRIMYPHHIMSRNENETIKKIYSKKGDWFELFKKEFASLVKKLLKT